MAICSEEGLWSSLLGLKNAGTPRFSTLSGSVWRAGGAGGVSLWPVGEGAWVARFLPVWLLDMLDPSIGGRPERALGPGSDFPREMVRLVADEP
jgi:hypothetical protein